MLSVFALRAWTLFHLSQFTQLASVSTKLWYLWHSICRYPVTFPFIHYFSPDQIMEHLPFHLFCLQKCSLMQKLTVFLPSPKLILFITEIFVVWFQNIVIYLFAILSFSPAGTVLAWIFSFQFSIFFVFLYFWNPLEFPSIFTWCLCTILRSCRELLIPLMWIFFGI